MAAATPTIQIKKIPINEINKTIQARKTVIWKFKNSFAWSATNLESSFFNKIND
jgi:hypothetical protein